MLANSWLFLPQSEVLFGSWRSSCAGVVFCQDRINNQNTSGSLYMKKNNVADMVKLRHGDNIAV